MANQMKWLIRFFTGTFLAVFLFVSLLFINVLQVLSLLIVPFSKRAFRAVNRGFAGTYWSILAFGALKIQGVTYQLTGDPIPADENALIISNHQGFMDPMFPLFMASERGRLADLKWFSKDILKYVPGMGWGLMFLDCIFLKRDWARDRASIEKTFARLKTSGIRFWLVTYPEGTRMTASKLKASQEHARTKSKKVLNYVLSPKTKGFVATMKGLEGRIDAVYDYTIMYGKTPFGKIPTVLAMVSQTVGPVRVHTQRFPIATLPSASDESGLAAWLQKRFEEKDALIADHYRSLGHRGVNPEKFRLE